MHDWFRGKREEQGAGTASIATRPRAPRQTGRCRAFAAEKALTSSARRPRRRQPPERGLPEPRALHAGRARAHAHTHRGGAGRSAGRPGGRPPAKRSCPLADGIADDGDLAGRPRRTHNNDDNAARRSSSACVPRRSRGQTDGEARGGELTLLTMCAHPPSRRPPSPSLSLIRGILSGGDAESIRT